MPKTRTQKSTQRGFTLVELSIVLVIIGLIVGGVLTGQALIQAAKVRAQLTQIEQLDTAMNAFRSKFDCLPGDCPASSGVLNAVGNGDGLVNYVAAAGDTPAWSATLESAVAWSQMAGQNMVAGNYTPDDTFTTTQLGAAKLGTGGSILIGSDIASNTNLYALAIFASDLTTSDLIPADAARSIDSKRDDGLPNSGTTQGVAAGNADPFTAAAAAPGSTASATDCVVVTGTGSTAVTAYQAGETSAICTVRTRISG